MTLDTHLLEILACPQDKGPLMYLEDEDTLYNPRLKMAYPIREGIPVMLIDEARVLDDSEHDALLERAAAKGVDVPDSAGAD